MSRRESRVQSRDGLSPIRGLYLDTLESELPKFPKGKNDDHVDMAVYAARLMGPVKSQHTNKVVYEEENLISPA